MDNFFEEYGAIYLRRRHQYEQGVITLAEWVEYNAQVLAKIEALKELVKSSLAKL